MKLESKYNGFLPIFDSLFTNLYFYEDASVIWLDNTFEDRDPFPFIFVPYIMPLRSSMKYRQIEWDNNVV